MFFSSTTISTALVAVTLFSQASSSVASHARGFGHQRRGAHVGHAHLDAHAKRADAGNVELPLGQLQMLQSEYTTFKFWITTGFNESASLDAATYLSQLKQEFTAYDGWMTAWLNSALNAGSPSAPPAPATSPLLPLPSAEASGPASGASSGAAGGVPSSTPVILSFAQQKAHNSRTHVPTSTRVPIGGPAPSHSQPAGGPGPAAPASAATSSSAPANPGGPASVPSNTPSASASPPVSASPPASSASAAPSAAPSSGGGGGPSSGGSFNAAASNNVAVYYGQTAATSQVKLSDLCAAPGNDIIILAFLTTYFGPGGYPTLNFGSACSSAGAAATAKGATGLLTCPDLAKEIQTCQSAGKIVLLSLGGSEAVSAFTSDSQATTFATQLTNLFTGGTGESSDLRPFGSLKIDGFDIDNEDHSTAHYPAFISALRKALDADSSKKYYISAAPQCPRPDASIPLSSMQADMDFIFVQFYNNGDCNVGQPGFLESFKAWSGDLSGNGGKGKLFIGAPACASCAGSGYLDPQAMDGVVASVKGAGVGNWGGVMLWDGAEGVVNGGYQGGVKKALG